MAMNKKARIEKEAVQIPEDVTIEILKKLPVKSRLGLRGVCQTWYALITHPKFCNKRSCVVIGKKRGREFSTISVESILTKGKHLVWGPRPLSLPWAPLPIDTSRFLGSCNGLVCLYQSSPLLRDGTGALIFWNPSTGKSIKLPATRRVPPNGYSQGRSAGFGCDESRDEYKLVWMACNGKKSMIEFDVFSLKSRTWSSFHHCRPSNIILSSIFGGRHCAGVFSNGAIHWSVCHKDRSSNNGILILALDLAKDKYKLLETPKGCDLGSKVASLSGYLCLYTGRGGFWTDLWMMKEYGVDSSWIKLVSLPTPPGKMLLCKDHPIHFLNEGGSIVATFFPSRNREIMRLQVKNGAIVSYETLSSIARNDFTFVLEESLVSLNRLAD